MKMNYLMPFLLMFAFISCGDNSPFDEDYWVDPNVRTEEDAGTNEEVLNFSVELTPLVADAANVSGSATINVNQTEVITTTQLSEVPESLMIGKASITTLTCAEVIATSPTPTIPNNTGELKTIDLTDTGTREALIADLNQADPQNGDSINLDGKRYVIKAYVSNLNTPAPQAASLIPVACGTILIQEDTDEDDDDEDDDGGTGGGTTGGTTGGGETGTTISGSIGGTIGGGTTGGTIGGTIGTTAGGGETGTFIGGSIGGTIGATVGGTGF